MFINRSSCSMEFSIGSSMYLCEGKIFIQIKSSSYNHPWEEPKNHSRQSQYLQPKRCQEPWHSQPYFQNPIFVLYLSSLLQFYIRVFDHIISLFNLVLYFIEIATLLLNHKLDLFHYLIVGLDSLCQLIKFLCCNFNVLGLHLIKDDRFGHLLWLSMKHWAR